MRKNEKKMVVWSNYDVEIDNDFYDEFYPDADEYERYRLAEESLDIDLDDIREELDIDLGQPILVIGSLGLWNGTFSGYKEIDSGNIKDCLYDSDCNYMEWYVDSLGDFRAKGSHHDGNNHYLYRAYKENVSDTQIENLKEKLYYGKATRKDITRITKKIGDIVAERF